LISSAIQKTQKMKGHASTIKKKNPPNPDESIPQLFAFTPQAFRFERICLLNAYRFSVMTQTKFLVRGCYPVSQSIVLQNLCHDFVKVEILTF
jgi:hypothetical protein